MYVYDSATSYVIDGDIFSDYFKKKKKKKTDKLIYPPPLFLTLVARVAARIKLWKV